MILPLSILRCNHPSHTTSWSQTHNSIYHKLFSIISPRPERKGIPQSSLPLPITKNSINFQKVLVLIFVKQYHYQSNINNQFLVIHWENTHFECCHSPSQYLKANTPADKIIRYKFKICRITDNIIEDFTGHRDEMLRNGEVWEEIILMRGSNTNSQAIYITNL